MKQFILATLFLLLLTACGGALPTPTPLPATPTPIPRPTGTPLPPDVQAQVDEYEAYVSDVMSILNLYERDNVDKAALDRDLRSLVPTIEALHGDLVARGVEIPPVPLPPTPALAVDTEVFDIGMVAEDKVKIRGTYYTPGAADAPGIVLLHMLGGQRGAWDTFAQQLQAAGYGVLAIDLRGHGESEGSRDWPDMVKDAAIAAEYLRHREEIDDSRIGMIGASIGANIALNYAANDPNIQSVILLSPGLDYRGVSTTEAIAAIGERALLIVASEEDSYAADSSRTLAETAGDLIMLENQGHGTRMLGRGNGLEKQILAWLGRDQ